MNDAADTTTTPNHSPATDTVIVRTKYHGRTEHRAPRVVARGLCHRLGGKRYFEPYSDGCSVVANHACAAVALVFEHFEQARCISWTSSATADGFLFVFAI